MTEVLLPSPHPLTPPRSEEEWVAWFRLLRSRRVGPSTFRRLLEEHGDVDAALTALPQVAADAGVKDYQTYPADLAQAELDQGRKIGATPISLGSPQYPEILTQIADAPPILWSKGDLSLLARPMVALVGARNASSLGTRMARRLATDLGAAGNVIVSGLARGIDTAAHLASIETGTIAVVAGSVDVIYPKENAPLVQDIAARGLILSEQPIGMQPMSRHFPRRNRIISGLSRALVVVEAAVKSGSLITARNALDQGREVLVVPGHPLDPRAGGCNMLLRDGATLVRSAEDIVEAMQLVQSTELDEPELPLETPANPPNPPSHARQIDLHKTILDCLGPTPMAEDQLIRDIQAPAETVGPELLALELEGKVLRQAGGLISRSH